MNPPPKKTTRKKTSKVVLFVEAPNLLFGFFDPQNPQNSLPPMVQWKMGVSPILVSFHLGSDFPLNPWKSGRFRIANFEVRYQ